MASWLNSLFIRILNMSITAGYCIAAVLLIRLLFRKAPRKYLYVLWLVAAFRLICPVSLSTDFSLFNLEPFSESRPAADVGQMQYIPEQITRMDNPEVHTGLKAADRLVNQQIPRVGAEVKIHGIPLKNMLYTYGFHPVGMLLAIGKYVWAAGMAAFLIYFLVSIRKLKRSVRMAVKAEASGWEAGIGPESDGGIGSSRYDIYECDQLSSPFAMGLLRPRIYLPCRLAGEQRRMILLHEQYHIYRKDHLVKLLAFLLLAVYWFHPLVWAAWFGMCKDMEMSCDERVLELLGEEQKKAYGLTLLAFAADRRSGSRMPLGFGEHDVKSRIKHTLSFQQPAVWAGVLAAIAIAGVLLVFGTNSVRQPEEAQQNAAGSASEEENAGDCSEIARKLYEARNPYVGDASANGRLLGVIAEALPDTLAAHAAFTTELQTSEEPYEFCFVVKETLEGAPYQYSLAAPAVLMLALTDNLGVVEWRYQIAGGADRDRWSVQQTEEWSVQQAEEWCGVKALKEYGSSPERIQELLDLLTARSADGRLVCEWSLQDNTGDTDEFLKWYETLPYALYENAVTLTEYITLSVYDTEQMVILAQTEDKTVTVYGCFGSSYGYRGITVDYRTGPDGDSSHTYLDLCWNAAYNSKVFTADFDRDGRDEIALTLAERQGLNSTAERLLVFETYETGHVEPYVFTAELQQEEIGRLTAPAVDTNNRQVHIVRKDSESSVPLVSISYGEDETVTGVDLSKAVGFELGEELYMYAAVGMRMGDSTLVYGYGNDWTERLLRFRVIYDYSQSMGGGYFTLTDVSGEEEAFYGGVKTLQQ